jgi:predicted transcriptional regulator
MEAMKTLIVRVESFDDVKRTVIQAVRTGKAEYAAGLSFPSYDALYRILTPKRLEIVRAMAGQSAMSIREVARRVGRDFKGVHTDVTALVNAGVLDREKGGVVFPYERIHVEFDIEAAA